MAASARMKAAMKTSLLQCFSIVSGSCLHLLHPSLLSTPAGKQSGGQSPPKDISMQANEIEAAGRR